MGIVRGFCSIQVGIDSRAFRFPPDDMRMPFALPDATRRGGQRFLGGQKVLKNPPGAPDAIAALCFTPAAFCAYAPGPPCAE